jgi:hypothetical protein
MARVEILDIVLLGITIATGSYIIRCWARYRKDWAFRSCLLIIALLTVSLAAHPSVSGCLLIARVLGVCSLALLIRESADRRGPIVLLIVFVLSNVAQAIVAVGQVIHHGPVGLGLLGELPIPLAPVGSALASRGTFQHAYPLAGFALLGCFVSLALLVRHARKILFLALAVGAIPLGITYSRAGILGLLAGLAAVSPALRQARGRLAAGILAILAGVALPMFLWSGGWTSRAETTSVDAMTRNVEALGSNRPYLAGGALTLIASNPVIGVGPGLYYPGSPSALRTTPVQPSEIVHNLPLYVAVEGGVLPGTLLCAILLVVGVIAIKRDAFAASVYLSFLPFVLLDRFTYDGVHGLAMIGAWLGTVGLLIRLRAMEHASGQNAGNSPATASRNRELPNGVPLGRRGGS